jgi:dipeptidyl aminopeptidase/acylaminoacyl peptidase
MKHTTFYLGLLGFCALLNHTAPAQNRFMPEDLWRLGMVSDPQVSPDGKNILYGIKTTDLAENKGNNELFVMTIDGRTSIQLTHTPASEFNARWRPDGKKIGFLMVENGSPQLFEMNPDGSGLEKISNEAGGIEGFEYSPKGDNLLYYRSVVVKKNDATLYKDLPKATGKVYDGLLYRHWTEWADGSFQHVFLQGYQQGELVGKEVDLMAGEPFDAPLKPMGGIEQITWRPDGKALAYTCKKKTGTADATSTNSDIYLYEIDTKTTKNLSEGMMGYDVEPRFSPDGSKIAWQSMERDGYEADKNRLMVKDLKTGKVTDVTAKSDITIESFVWSSNSQLIYFMVQTKGTIQIYEWDSRKPEANWVEAITKGDHNYTALTLYKAGKQDMLIATRQSMLAPNEIYQVDPINEAETKLTKVNDAFLAGFKPSRIEKRLVKASDGKEILTWLVLPPDFDPAKKYPSVLFCQGGPQSMVGQSFSVRWNFQMMAQQGYVMILPNRRGLPGFGQEWNEQISGDWGGQAMQDLLSVSDAMAKEPFVDASRMAAVGASFGGYSVYWLAGQHQKRFKAFIAHCGVFNLESMFGATEELWFSNWDMKGPYWQEPTPKSYTQFSPHLFVKNWDTPMLVIHNDKDFRVPLTEGLQAFTAAQLKQVPSRFLYFPDEGHWVLKPQNSVLWNRVFFDWLDRYLKK